MESWIVWLIVAAVLGVAELVTITFAFGIIAVAAVVAAVVGAFHLDLAIQLAAFVVATALYEETSPRATGSFCQPAARATPNTNAPASVKVAPILKLIP